MFFRGCTENQIYQAVRIINRNDWKSYEGNITVNVRPYRNGWQGTLGVKDSKGIGARRSSQGRRIKKACWHAHGDFFTALFMLAPEAKVNALGRTLERDFDWTDWNAGSIEEPALFSTLCDCTARQVILINGNPCPYTKTR